ncbi:hypothetical protein [Niveibacterium sp. SC-1]|uniref:hypothetical protein n=1 Tax=Niveibacterium sp. SC-1 TaxID=3135646 RepID=UPI00311DDF44
MATDDQDEVKFLQCRVYLEDGEDLFAWIQQLPKSNFRRRVAIVAALREGARVLMQGNAGVAGAPVRPVAVTTERSPQSGVRLAQPSQEPKPPAMEVEVEAVVSLPADDLTELFGPLSIRA